MHGPARAQLRGRSHHLHPARAAQPDAAALAAALAAAALAAARAQIASALTAPTKASEIPPPTA